MTIEQCYRQLGGDYAQMLSRLSNSALVEKFALMFLNDPSFAELSAAVAQKDAEQAFRAAHTLKGVSANLSFLRLHSSASELVELLRGRTGDIPPEATPMMARIESDYCATVAAIQAFAQH